jgi:hypothetical protein
VKARLPWYLDTSSKQINRGCAILFTLPFFLAGLFCLWSMCLTPAWNWLNAQGWEKSEAVIEKASLETNEDGDGDTYKVAVKYSYDYRGTPYPGTRYSFTSGATNVGVAGMRATVRSLSANKKVTCWVNPNKPSEAVIDRSLPGQAIIGLFFSVPFITVGLVGWGIFALPWIRRRVRAARLAQLEDMVMQGRLPRWVMQAFEERPVGKRDLALVIAADERLPAALGLTFLNLFWNGIVSVFVIVAISSWISGEYGEGTFLSLFLIPFVLVGAGVFWYTIKYWAMLRRSGWVAAMLPVPGFDGREARFCWAWLDAGRLEQSPQAEVRIVAQAARWWDSESESPGRSFRRKRSSRRLSGAKARKDEMELVAVAIPRLDFRGDTPVQLPSAPPPPPDEGKRRFGIPNAPWGRWWELEITYPDGEVETSELCAAEKIP